MPSLSQPLLLPCGLTLKNRLAKSAMSDSLGDGTGNMTEAQAQLYKRWADGGLALSIIGEVQVDPRYPEKPGNLVLSPDGDLDGDLDSDLRGNLDAMRHLAEQGQARGAALWPQLGHAGALAHPPISDHAGPVGPSALDLDGLRCAAITDEEIAALPGRYAAAASLAKQIGFKGVQIHAGHGFLLSQFLSPLFNKRTDGYGGSIDRRVRIVLEILEAVRLAVGQGFPIGLKMNATDMLEGGLSQEESLDAIRLIDRDSSVDLIDISGGTYFPGAKSSSDSAAQGGAYFLEYAQRAKAFVKIPLMVTGGFKRRADAMAAVESGAVDMVGLARALVLEPRLPDIWLNDDKKEFADAKVDPSFPRFETPVEGAVTAWYTLRLAALAEGREAGFDLDAMTALERYNARDQEREARWNARWR